MSLSREEFPAFYELVDRIAKPLYSMRDQMAREQNEEAYHASGTENKGLISQLWSAVIGSNQDQPLFIRYRDKYDSILRIVKISGFQDTMRLSLDPQINASMKTSIKEEREGRFHLSSPRAKAEMNLCSGLLLYLFQDALSSRDNKDLIKASHLLAAVMEHELMHSVHTTDVITSAVSGQAEESLADAGAMVLGSRTYGHESPVLEALQLMIEGDRLQNGAKTGKYSSLTAWHPYPTLRYAMLRSRMLNRFFEKGLPKETFVEVVNLKEQLKHELNKILSLHQQFLNKGLRFGSMAEALSLLRQGHFSSGELTLGQWTDQVSKGLTRHQWRFSKTQKVSFITDYSKAIVDRMWQMRSHLYSPVNAIDSAFKDRLPDGEVFDLNTSQQLVDLIVAEAQEKVDAHNRTTGKETKWQRFVIESLHVALLLIDDREVNNAISDFVSKVLEAEGIESFGSGYISSVSNLILDLPHESALPLWFNLYSKAISEKKSPIEQKKIVNYLGFTESRRVHPLFFTNTDQEGNQYKNLRSQIKSNPISWAAYQSLARLILSHPFPFMMADLEWGRNHQVPFDWRLIAESLNMAENEFFKSITDKFLAQIQEIELKRYGAPISSPNGSELYELKWQAKSLFYTSEILSDKIYYYENGRVDSKPHGWMSYDLAMRLFEGNEGGRYNQILALISAHYPQYKRAFAQKALKKQGAFSGLRQIMQRVLFGHDTDEARPVSQMRNIPPSVWADIISSSRLESGRKAELLGELKEMLLSELPTGGVDAVELVYFNFDELIKIFSEFDSSLKPYSFFEQLYDHNAIGKSRNQTTTTIYHMHILRAIHTAVEIEFERSDSLSASAKIGAVKKAVARLRSMTETAMLTGHIESSVFASSEFAKFREKILDDINLSEASFDEKMDLFNTLVPYSGDTVSDNFYRDHLKPEIIQRLKSGQPIYIAPVNHRFKKDVIKVYDPGRATIPDLSDVDGVNLHGKMSFPVPIGNFQIQSESERLELFWIYFQKKLDERRLAHGSIDADFLYRELLVMNLMAFPSKQRKDLINKIGIYIGTSDLRLHALLELFHNDSSMRFVNKFFVNALSNFSAFIDRMNQEELKSLLLYFRDRGLSPASETLNKAFERMAKLIKNGEIFLASLPGHVKDMSVDEIVELIFSDVNTVARTSYLEIRKTALNVILESGHPALGESEGFMDFYLEKALSLTGPEEVNDRDWLRSSIEGLPKSIRNTLMVEIIADYSKDRKIDFVAMAERTKTLGKKAGQATHTFGLLNDPEENARFRKLKDQSDPISIYRGLKILKDELSANQWKQIESGRIVAILGAASLKTVYLVETGSGQQIAFGVVNPDGLPQIETQKNYFAGVLSDLNRKGKLKSPKFYQALFEDLADQTFDEINMKLEYQKMLEAQEALKKVNRDFAHSKEYEGWTIKGVESASGFSYTKNSIAMNYVEGVPLDDSSLSKEDRYMAERLTVNAFFHAFFNYGWIDADRHLGNVLVNTNVDKNGQKSVIFLDPGQSRTIKMARSPFHSDGRTWTSDFLYGIAVKDYNFVEYSILKTSNVDKLNRAQRARIKPKVESILASKSDSLEQVRGIIEVFIESGIRPNSEALVGIIKGFLVILSDTSIERSELSHLLTKYIIEHYRSNVLQLGMRPANLRPSNAQGAETLQPSACARAL